LILWLILLEITIFLVDDHILQTSHSTALPLRGQDTSFELLYSLQFLQPSYFYVMRTAQELFMSGGWRVIGCTGMRNRNGWNVYICPWMWCIGCLQEVLVSNSNYVVWDGYTLTFIISEPAGPSVQTSYFPLALGSSLANRLPCSLD